MKFLVLFLILAGTAFGQAPGKIITFSQADTEHCKVVVVRGKPLLQSTYEGTTVSIAMPLNRGNGDFSIFVAVSRAGSGAVEADPKDFYGLFSDQDHTRFRFYDKASEIALARAPVETPSIPSASTKIDPPAIRPGSEGGGPTSGSGPGDDAPREGTPDMSVMYFRKGKIKPGSGIAGWITLRQPNGGKLEVHSTDMLGEVDIPVNGILFRF